MVRKILIAKALKDSNILRAAKRIKKLAETTKEKTEIELKDEEGVVRKFEVKEISIPKNFDSVLINFKTNSGTTKRYLLRRTKRDRLVLT